MTEAQRVGNAIRDSINWEVVGKAAIQATDHYAEIASIFDESRSRIEDYDTREAAGEDVTNEVRPRMPGGSDW